MPTSMPRPPNWPCVADLQLLERFLIEVGGMRVEARQHAVDRLGDELLVLDRLDVVGLDGGRTPR